MSFPNREGVSQGLKDLISRMLEKSPSSRITIDQIKNNEWINEGYQLSLGEQGAQIFANLSDTELANQGISVEEMKMAQAVGERLN